MSSSELIMRAGLPRSLAANIITVLLLGAGLHADAVAQAPDPRQLAFESTGPAAGLTGWGGGPPTSIFLDSAVVHGGRYAVRLEIANGGVWVTGETSLTFGGDTIELRGWLKRENVKGFTGLSLRLDSRNGTVVQFDNMQRRQLSGTADWTQYSVKLPIDGRARSVLFGALLVGEGKVWADDLELLVDGKSAAQAPAFVPVLTPIEADSAFDRGSGIATTRLTSLQIDNLVLLGKVWGFVKYHHPRIAAGQVNWDYELFRVLPDVLAARDRAAAAQHITVWVDKLGQPQPCAPCAVAPANMHLMPEIDWIRDAQQLGAELSRRLVAIHRNRPAGGEHHFIQHAPNVGNPIFDSEAQYPRPTFPDAGYRMLALFRFWNIVEYWFPYRDLIEEEWDGVLREFVPKLMNAHEEVAYRLAMMEVTARVHDTHANVWSQLELRPPRGTAMLPVTIRFIEGKAVVAGYTHATLGPATGLVPGDVIETIDGQRVDSLVVAWRPLYAASNEPTRLRDIAHSLTRGDTGAVRVAGRTATGAFDRTLERVPLTQLDTRAGATHDLPGEAFQLLTEEVAYLKLSSVAVSQIDEYMRRAAGTKVLVIDIRNYPSEFVVFALGSRLVTQRTPFARFTNGDITNPGAFTWTEPVAVEPDSSLYGGRVVILVDEVSQSQAEYTTMALRTAPGALVVGSTTAGADGNSSPIPLPGGIASMISGIGVFYPDRSPTQRIGIIPDLEVRPTIAGIRAGRDEVLEAGVSRALGRPFRLPARLRLPDGSLPDDANTRRTGRAAAARRAPAVHLLRQGRRRNVPAA
jgi:C-terminal processing protease CtpA/Prc